MEMDYAETGIAVTFSLFSNHIIVRDIKGVLGISNSPKPIKKSSIKCCVLGVFYITSEKLPR